MDVNLAEQWRKMLRSGRTLRAEMPPKVIHTVDQTQASLREVAEALDVDLLDVDEARAALMGMHYLASAVLEALPDADARHRIAVVFNMTLLAMWDYVDAEKLINEGDDDDLPPLP